MRIPMVIDSPKNKTKVAADTHGGVPQYAEEGFDGERDVEDEVDPHVQGGGALGLVGGDRLDRAVSPPPVDAPGNCPREDPDDVAVGRWHYYRARRVADQAHSGHDKDAGVHAKERGDRRA